MKNLFSIFIKIFFVASLLFILPRLIWSQFFPTYIKESISPSLNWVILQGVIMALALSILLTAVHAWFVRRLSQGESDSIDYGVRQLLETEAAQPLHALFQDLKNQLSLKHWKIVRQDESRSILQFKTKPSWHSWGEIVTIELQPEEVQLTRVKVESKPLNWMVLTDNGKNLRNIQTVKHALGIKQ